MIDTKEYEFVRFELTERKPKTGVWSCRNIRSGEELGIVKWYGPWRQYCYFPTIQAIYSKGCLSDINDFITLISKK